MGGKKKKDDKKNENLLSEAHFDKKIQSKEKGNERKYTGRYLVGIIGAGGSGKSFLANLLSYIINKAHCQSYLDVERQKLKQKQVKVHHVEPISLVLSMDGYHFPNT